MKTAAVDFETANENPASVCAVGISTLDEGVLEDAFYSLIRPEDNVNRFSKWNMAVHHIAPSDVIDAPRFSTIYSEIRRILEGSLVCAHNARFDMTCLKKACLNTGMPLPHFEYFDTVALSRHAFPELDHHRLNDVCDYLGISLNHHHAGSDASGCLQIVAACMEISGIYDVKEMLAAYHTTVYKL